MAVIQSRSGRAIGAVAVGIQPRRHLSGIGRAPMVSNGGVAASPTASVAISACAAGSLALASPGRIFLHTSRAIWQGSRGLQQHVCNARCVSAGHAVLHRALRLNTGHRIGNVGLSPSPTSIPARAGISARAAVRGTRSPSACRRSGLRFFFLPRLGGCSSETRAAAIFFHAARDGAQRRASGGADQFERRHGRGVSQARASLARSIGGRL